MARERMVTRTVNGYKVTAMTVNTVNAEISNDEFIMGADYAPDKGLNMLRKMYETDSYKIVTITATEQFEQLYGMSEKKFIENAELLPPRGEKTEN